MSNSWKTLLMAAIGGILTCGSLYAQGEDGTFPGNSGLTAAMSTAPAEVVQVAGRAMDASLPSGMVRITVDEDETVTYANPNGTHHNSTHRGGLYVGMGRYDYGPTRSYLKFSLSSLGSGASVRTATLYMYLNDEYWPADRDIGAYSAGDNWSETTITWNTAPSTTAGPHGSITAPFSPGHWYSWDVTTPVANETSGDGVLTLVMQENTEIWGVPTWNYFAEKEYSVSLAAYIDVELGGTPPVADAGEDQTVEQETADGTEVTLDGRNSSGGGTEEPLTTFAQAIAAGATVVSVGSLCQSYDFNGVDRSTGYGDYDFGFCPGSFTYWDWWYSVSSWGETWPGLFLVGDANGGKSRPWPTDASGSYCGYVDVYEDDYYPPSTTPWRLFLSPDGSQLAWIRLNDGGGGSAELEVASIEDETVYQGLPDRNYSNSPYMWVGTWYGRPNTATRSFLKFDVSGVPVGATIDSAMLYVYLLGKPHFHEREVGVYGASDNWSADTLTWNNAPATTYGPHGTRIISEGPQQWTTFDVTNIVKTEANGDDVATMVLRELTESGYDTGKTFAESEYSTDSVPYLELRYTTGSGGGGGGGAGSGQLSYEWREGETLLGTDPVITVTLPLGIHYITLTVTDAAGQSDTDEVVVTIEDTTAPVLTCPDDITVEQETADGTVVIWECSVADICDADVAVACDPVSGSVFPLGTTEVTCTTIDASGNQATCSFNVTVEDTTPPALTCPDDITVEQETADGTVVTWECSVTDICDADVAIACDPVSGSVFPLGTTEVTCTTMDASGNVATCSFNVTVEDTTAPTASLQILKDKLWPPNHKMVLAAVVAGVLDICDIAPDVSIVVTSDEPINGVGDGNTEPDWQVVQNGDAWEIWLRAERSGTSDGRVYTIEVTVTDDSGNASVQYGEVVVPHDQGRGKKK